MEPRPAAERRVLHVMFCDLVGSTALSERLDPEDYRELLRAYYRICEDAVDRYGGHVAKYMGDGALIYFGYPVAHDDDARRAMLAALEITVAVPALRSLVPTEEEDPSVRIGIHTGLTVIGETGQGSTYEALAVGETPNVAARLQQLAVPNEVVVSETTRRLAEEHFEFRGLGAQQLKGVAQPVHVFRVLGPARRSRPLRLERDLFVGRRAELHSIEQALADVRSGRERAVVVSGEPGMGKTRLVAAVRQRLAGTDVEWVEVTCSPFLGNTFLAPLLELVRERAGLQPADSPAMRLAQLERLLASTLGDPVEAIGLLAPLLGFDDGEYPPLEYGPEVRNRRTLDTLVAFLRGLAADGPAVVVVEDLQWADPSTLEVLGELVEHPSTARLLLFATHRPEFERWAGAAADRLVLQPLEAVDVDALIRHFVGEHGLDDRALKAIADRADGIPFFVEELVKFAHESGGLTGNTVGGAAAIPVTLQGLLTGELDRLGPAKRLAQLGSILGRRFTVDLLDAVSSGPTDLDVHLKTLVRADVLVPLEAAGRPSFEFRHALIQEAAYDSMLRSDRRRLHGVIAGTYEARYPDEVADRPEVVGQHWQRAGHHHRAAPYFARAGARAAQAYAHEEALALYGRAIDSIRHVLADGNEPNDEWRVLLLDVHERTGDVLTLRRRLEEAELAYRAALDASPDPVRASRLHRRIGVVWQQDRERALAAFDEAEQVLGAPGETDDVEWRREWLGVHLSRMRMHYWYGESDEMLRLEQRVRSHVDGVATPVQRAEYFDQATLRRFRDERYAMSDETLAAAEEYVRAAESAGDLTELASAHFTYGFALTFSARPAAALEQLRVALELARRCGHRTIEIRCITYLATAHRMAGDVDDAERYGVLSRDESLAANMTEYVGVSCGNLAWVALRRGDHAAARALAAQALDAWDACELAFPFQWIAALPLLAVARDTGDLIALGRCATALTGPVQQRLPAVVLDPVADLGIAVAAGEQDRAIALADRVLRASAELSLLVI
jgi:class 3 adenylate cyclase/tetratricopeptide (TPR) repeat protein